MDGGMIFLIILVIVLTLSTGFFAYQYYYYRGSSIRKDLLIQDLRNDDFN